uniref:outer envelope pore protein 16-2, chloroplastic-like n=1 Tax=Erigeron canadensis TaxID=72917 RepID=UPI001CB91344|nr:outer envelope pore protein 16-2, chloroplastic-like [Erigeron canadensis]
MAAEEARKKREEEMTRMVQSQQRQNDMDFVLLKKKKRKIMGHNLETRSVMDEVRSYDDNSVVGGLVDFGHPLINRIAGTFVTAAGIGAVQAVTREAYFTALETASGDKTGISSPKKHNPFRGLRGESNSSSIEGLVKATGKESIQWGLAAGVYSGLTYGFKEARGVHDWRNSAVAGAMTGAALALTSDNSSQEQIVQFAITGAAVSTAANILTGIF